MSQAVPFTTDLATLAAFDPKTLAHRIRQPSSWWKKPNVAEVDEVRAGKAAIWPVGGEGSFAVRLGLASEAPLTDEERALVRGEVAGQGLVVESGDVFVGAGERIPGDGLGDRIVAIPGIGTFVKVPPGSYTTVVHVLDVRSEARFFDDEGERRADAPADFVVLLSPRETFTAPANPGTLLARLPRPEKPKAVAFVPRPRPPEREPRARSAPSSPLPAPAPEPLEPVASSPGPFELSLLKRAMREVVRARAAGTVPPGISKAFLWLKPRDPGLQAKELGVDDLMGKVTRCREQLRVLEQRVNGHETLSDAEKLNLDAQITQCYEAFAAVLDVTRT